MEFASRKSQTVNRLLLTAGSLLLLASAAWGQASGAPSGAPSATASASASAVAAATPDDPSGIDWMHQISIIAFFLVITCFLAWLCVKLLYNKNGNLGVSIGRGGGKGQLRVLERCMLMPQKGIFLVQAGDKTLLIGATEHQITALAELDSTALAQQASPPASTDAGPFQFQQFLSSLVSTRRPDR